MENNSEKLREKKPVAEKRKEGRGERPEGCWSSSQNQSKSKMRIQISPLIASISTLSVTIRLLRS